MLLYHRGLALGHHMEERDKLTSVPPKKKKKKKVEKRRHTSQWTKRKEMTPS